MPSNKKRRVHARMNKTGESYATALRHVREKEGAGTNPGPARKARTYSGTPKLPPVGPASWMMKLDGTMVPAEPQMEFVNIQGDFDPADFSKAYVPETAFVDPTMERQPGWPEGEQVCRVLSLEEYIDAREEQTGWKLDRVQPGSLVMFGKILNVLLYWRTKPSS